MRPRLRGAVALLLAALLVVALAPAASAIDDPQLSAFVPSPNLEPGETTTVTVQLLNDGDGDPVAAAENVRATLEADRVPIEVQSGTLVVGDIEDGGVASVDFHVRVPAGAEPGRYRLEVDLEYVADDETVERTRAVRARIERAPRFRVVSAETDAIVGDGGTLSVRLENAGSAPATDVTLRLESVDPALTFGGGPVAAAYVGRVERGAEATVDVGLEVARDATVRPYAVDATIAYEDPDGDRVNREVPVSVTPRGEPAFAVESVRADLRVGDRGTILATVANTGETVARDATVRLAVPWANGTSPAEYPVGDLAPGASATARFTVDVPPGLAPGRERVDLQVSHAAASGPRLVSDPLGASVEVEPRRPTVAVEPVDATFEVDETGRLTVRLTNRGDAPVTAVRAALETVEPLSSEDPVAFVPRLAPDGSATVAFHLEVSEDAVPGSHPVSVSLAYDDADGNPRLVEGRPVGVTVVAPADAGFPVAAVAVAVIAGLAGAIWWYRRR